jgi:hypothetical protein
MQGCTVCHCLGHAMQAAVARAVNTMCTDLHASCITSLIRPLENLTAAACFQHKKNLQLKLHQAARLQANLMSVIPQVREYCKGQVALSVASHTGRVLDCTGVQLAGMLDDLFATDEPLGDHICADSKSRAVSVWVRVKQLLVTVGAECMLSVLQQSLLFEHGMCLKLVLVCMPDRQAPEVLLMHLIMDMCCYMLALPSVQEVEKRPVLAICLTISHICKACLRHTGPSMAPNYHPYCCLLACLHAGWPACLSVCHLCIIVLNVIPAGSHSAEG